MIHPAEKAIFHSTKNLFTSEKLGVLEYRSGDLPKTAAVVFMHYF